MSSVSFVQRTIDGLRDVALVGKEGVGTGEHSSPK